MAKLGAAASIGVGSIGMYVTDDGGQHWAMGYGKQFAIPRRGVGTARFAGKLWMAYTADGTNNLLRITSSDDDGATWSPAIEIPGRSKATPALAVFNGRLWMGIIADNATNTLLLASSTDGVSWSGFAALPGSSKAGVGMTEWNGRLWMAIVANNASNNLLIASSPDGSNWSSFGLVGGTMAVSQDGDPGPALAVFKNQLFLGLVANNASLQPLVMCSADGANWAPDVVVNTGEAFGAGLAVYAGELWMSFVAPSMLGFFLCSSPDGSNWSGNHITPFTNYGMRGAPIGLVAWGP